VVDRLEAAHPRHHLVEDDDQRIHLVSLRQRIGPRACFADDDQAVVRLVYQQPQQEPDIRLVVDDQGGNAHDLS